MTYSPLHTIKQFFSIFPLYLLFSNIMVTMRRELGAAIVLLIVLYLFFITVKKMDSFKVNNINYNVEDFPAFVLYNRVPKCGSSTLKSIVNQLRFRKGFVSIDSLEKDPYFGKMLMHQNVVQVAETKKLIQRLDNKTVFTEHSHFVNLDNTAVAYINLIRDPIARVNSAYCYARDLTKEFGKHQKINNRSISLGQCIQNSSIRHCVNNYNLFITIKYFCGKNDKCRHNPNTDYAMNLAITNIDKFYLVVGVIEQFKKTLKVLEYLLPEYFAGAVHVYEEQKKESRNVHNKCEAGLEPVQDKEDPIYQALKKHLYREYKVYNHVITTLEKQYKSIDNLANVNHL